MIRIDRDALSCDLAETYHIFDYKALSPSRVALFSVGLRNNSRIKLKLAGFDWPYETLILASIYDQLALQSWMKSKDAEHGLNKPKPLALKMLGTEQEKDLKAFATPDDYERARAEFS